METATGKSAALLDYSWSGKTKSAIIMYKEDLVFRFTALQD